MEPDDTAKRATSIGPERRLSAWGLTAMPPTARAPVEYPLDSLGPDEFEALAFLLARAESPEVVPVRNKDFGLDARLPDSRGRTLRGWQAKRFRGPIQWAKCRESVNRAMAFWRPPRITFCFANDLSAAEQKKFQTELVDHFPEVRLDFWGKSELQRRLRDTDEGKRAAAWLFSGTKTSEEALARAYAVGGPLEDGRQAGERQAVIQRFMDRDPHVHYTTVSRGVGGPETPPAPQTFLSVTLMHGDQEVRYDASARYPGALADLGSQPHLVFTNDDSGKRALEAVERVMREGGSATISSGMGAVMGEVPVGLKGLFPENGVWGEAEISAEDQTVVAAPPPADPMGGPMLLRCGDSEVGIMMSTADAPDGWEHAVHGSTGGLQMILMGRQGSDGKADLRNEWSYTRGEGSGREQLLAARIMLAVLERKPLELLRPNGDWLARGGVMESLEGEEEWRESLEQQVEFLGYVAEVEAWLGRELFPPADLTDADAKALQAIVSLIRQRETSLSWTRMELAPGATRPDNDGPWQFALVQPLHADLFGQRVDVATEFIHIPEGLIDASGDNLAVVPVGDIGEGTSRLYHPDEVPPSAARVPREEGESAEDDQIEKVGRNDPCPCGSGKKYKRCHGQ